MNSKCCKLCLTEQADKGFKPIDDNIKDILAVCLITHNPDKDANYICQDCDTKLFAAFDFKSTCLYVENKIVPYVESEETRLDLKEIYQKELDVQELAEVENDKKICRLCMQLIYEDSTPFDEVDVDMMDNYIPEVNFGITTDPVVCTPCLDSLTTHSSFLKDCLSLEENADSDSDDKPLISETPILKNEEMEESFIKVEEMKWRESDEEL